MSELGNGETRKPGEKLIPPEGMTKSAYKKLLRKKRHEETKVQYREHRKQIRKKKDSERKEEIEKLKTEGKQYEHLLKPRNKNKLIKTVANENEELITIDPINIDKKIGVVIDCGYDDYMNEKEVVSLSSQITRAYSTNRQAVKNYYAQKIEDYKNGLGLNATEDKDIAPAAKLVISGLDKRLKARFDKVLPDYKNWDPECAQLKEDSLVDVLDKWGSDGSKKEEDYSNIVYLSADTDDKLEELKAGDIYVVGGIVDKGRHKNLCKSTAEKLGQKISIKRLPIDEFIKLSGRKVLTTAHVVELLLKWCEYKDWKRAFEEVLPPRKMKEGDKDDSDEENLDEEKENDTKECEKVEEEK